MEKDWPKYTLRSASDLDVPAAFCEGARFGSYSFHSWSERRLRFTRPIVYAVFPKNRLISWFQQVFSSRNTGLIITLVPTAMYGVGLLRHDRQSQNTFLLSVEAVIGSEILGTVMKDIDRRLRPIDIPPDGNFSDTWFKSHGCYWRGSGSFPSGHELAAISVAAVLSRRHRNHRWVPWVAYGTAGLIGFSRVTLSSHFVSDVVTGAALGYSVTRFAVLQQ